MPRASTVVDVMLGEAGGRTPQQRYNDLLHVASVMVNRANLLGVPIEDVALNNQFNAYGQRLPAGVESYRTLAEQALTQVLEQGPVTDATFYATPVAVDNLPGGLAYTTETDSHRYFTDPHMRAIYTNDGYLTPQTPELANAPTPEAAPRWETAVPGAVERAALADVPSGLLGPSVTPSQGYGQLAETMGETPSLNLAGAMPSGELSAPAGGLLNPAVSEDRFASAAPVAQGLDSLRGGLLASNTAMGAPDPARFADAQVAQGMDGLRSGLLSYAENAAPAPAQTAIETVSPSAPAAAPSLADSYGQLAQSLDQANVLGLSGQKLYDPNAPMGELQQTGLLSSLPTQQPAPQTVQQQPAQEMGDYQDQHVSVAGPASPTVETQQGPTPPAEVGSFPSAPQTTGQKAKSIAGRVAGSLLGSAALGPVGGLLGGMLGNEIASGKGLFSGQGPQSIGGLLSSLGASVNNIGQGARQSYSVWGGGNPIGTQATATDGSRITQLGGGLLARTDANGVTTTFNDRGNIVGSPVSTGGLLAGIGRDISEAFGGSSSGGTGGVDTSGMSPGLW